MLQSTDASLRASGYRTFFSGVGLMLGQKGTRLALAQFIPS